MEIARGFYCMHMNSNQFLEWETVHGLLGLSPELGQRVHFAEGTNLRCREDKKSPTDDDEERLATMDGSLPPILISHDDTRAEGLRMV
ncbi:uncharacterized protein LOC100576172 isoform X2 [Apis mellifera]|uniref:Uncharacterized protein LOC100576172 isoform X2 n=1 Tax=Apis mellifera TaxID=7460 RepID=A0A7M7IFQ1_APIME|nr:uncharacterized protein LOC100576172 isoform X2 [Apis mellifera]|eukprot:XP_016768115.2 uncharacterized protein LOC100576172 isoform X2 [Apis mellifera]